MSDTGSAATQGRRWLPALLGIALLSYLFARIGPRTLWSQVHAVGYGLLVVIALGGLNHFVKTWAWRLTFTCDISRLSWSRSFAMRLVSEAIGQLGIAGKVLGEGARVNLLGSAVQTANAVSAAALDSGLYIFTSMFVAMAGVFTGLLVVSIPAGVRTYVFVFAGGLAAILILLTLGFVNGWRILGPLFNAVGRLRWCRNWVQQKQETIDSTEEILLNFHRDAPGAFWSSLMLNLFAHLLAITEVYVILRFLTPRATLVGAFVLEGLTKLISGIGALNPGNVGTFEAGNVIITRLFGIAAAAGLTLALCRRARALFWAAMGVICMVTMQRTRPDVHKERTGNLMTKDEEVPTAGEPRTKVESKMNCRSVIIVADREGCANAFSPSHARLATLPLLLRNILTVQATGPDRIIVAAQSERIEATKLLLSQTGRLPASIEWSEVHDRNLVPLLADVAPTSMSVSLVFSDRCFQPSILNGALEWSGSACLALASRSGLTGIYVLPQTAVARLAASGSHIETLAQLHSWLEDHESVELKEVPEDSWHKINAPEDLAEAERKLERWLVKPTDGIFARMNRRVSIPISRQLIKFPITPNMVTFFTLGVSLAAGAFYALGGYWNILIAAVLGVMASILDGCDGEVARMKLQSTAWGCWLDTICDYAYYVVAFGGMAVGLARQSGSRTYLSWGAALLFGAVTMFLVMSETRHHLSGSHPEKLLAVWQKKAESRSSNPLMYFGRQCEFVLRRCFLPYALLFFAVVNLTKVAFIMAAVGANVAWIIALYSYFDFSRVPRRAPTSAAVIAPEATAGICAGD